MSKGPLAVVVRWYEDPAYWEVVLAGGRTLNGADGGRRLFTTASRAVKAAKAAGYRVRLSQHAPLNHKP